MAESFTAQEEIKYLKNLVYVMKKGATPTHQQAEALAESMMISMGGSKWYEDEAELLIEQNQIQRPYLFEPLPGNGATEVKGGGGSVRSKSDLKTAKDKAAYIHENGANAYLDLPNE